MNVRIILHQDPVDSGQLVWWANSPDMPNWSAGGDTLEELKALCVEALDVVLERPDATIEYQYAPAVA